METRSGKVNNVLFETINKPGKRPFTVHRVQLANGDEVEVGFKQPYRVGDNFNSEVEFKFGKWKEVRALGGAAPATPAPSSPSGASTSGNGAPATFPIPKGNKESAIIRQNALTNAVKLFEVQAATSDEAALTDEVAAERVIQIAYKFAEFSSGQREVRLAKDLTGDSED
jgi:hypothetical protein